MNKSAVRIACFVGLLASLAGCTSSTVGMSRKRPPAPELARVREAFLRGDYQDALIGCVDLSRQDPDMPGLADLENRIMTSLAAERARAAALRVAAAQKAMKLEIEKEKSLPLTYGLRQSVQGATGSLRRASSAMQQVLDKKVTVNLDDVDLNTFIMAIGSSENVNIIADHMEGGKTMTLHATDVPLSEILEYIARNLDVSFYAGENLIWVTPRSEDQPVTPMETRVYRLRRGISGEELKAGPEKTSIMDALSKFVPEVEGSGLLFDAKTHVLIAKNTRENLAKVEDIVDALDVCPPQVLIEARFISTSVTDLSELGIDWMLKSPLTVTDRRYAIDNRAVKLPETQIDKGAQIQFAPFANQAEGLNLTYQGILTDPLFQAVLHALETSGKARTLSVPKITTVNNRPAMIRIGEDFRYFEEYDVQSTPSTITSQGIPVYETVLVPVGTPQLEELGIELKVTPSVGADLEKVTLQIAPQISEFVRYEYYDVAATSRSSVTNAGTNGLATSLVKLPIFRRSVIETEVVVRSGETVAMGGLISSSETRNQDRVPILSSLPLLGALFRHDKVDILTKNLLIFVTAVIISERGESLIPVTSGAAEDVLDVPALEAVAPEALAQPAAVP